MQVVGRGHVDDALVPAEERRHDAAPLGDVLLPVNGHDGQGGHIPLAGREPRQEPIDIVLPLGMEEPVHRRQRQRCASGRVLGWVHRRRDQRVGIEVMVTDSLVLHHGEQGGMHSRGWRAELIEEQQPTRREQRLDPRHGHEAAEEPDMIGDGQPGHILGGTLRSDQRNEPPVEGTGEGLMRLCLGTAGHANDQRRDACLQGDEHMGHGVREDRNHLRILRECVKAKGAGEVACPPIQTASHRISLRSPPVPPSQERSAYPRRGHACHRAPHRTERSTPPPCEAAGRAVPCETHAPRRSSREHRRGRR